ncbi:M28 family metallopeptidase [Candidatus Colwellia aromaticivorans]|uniref:M28 family metallopeptidase n=1 Tax=Candidatus Colwellia aromaticivorans TaxID=2267621 RepID=UPI001FE5FB94|nr:M28 family peptidase [Candidatus Colwellia aromaticivorans]
MFNEKKKTNSLSTLLMKVGVLITSLATASFACAVTNNISLAQVTKDVTYLASDDLKGRNNYSAEIRLAADYIAKRFQESGLVAADNISGADFLQKYQITKTIPKKINLTINGQNIASESLAMASTITDFSWAINNNVKNTEFTIHSIGKNDDMRAIVDTLNNQGGKHLVLLNTDHKALFERYQHYLQQGSTKLTQEDNGKNSGGVIVIALSTMKAEKIKTLNVSGVNTISKNELMNVVAILPGKTKPEEVVLYSAHYDHLGVKDDQSDVIYNGADDNASGTTAIINLAHYYAKQGDNARTLMFAAFSAEEIGGFGSSYFSKQLEPQTITAMINIEMIGKPSKFGAGTLWMTGMDRSNLGEQLNTVLAKSGKKIYEDPYPEQGLFYRSDNATLARLGVPAHSFSSAQLDKDQYYHQTSDDLSSLDLTSLHQIIEMLAMATQPLVDGNITPSRIDKKLVKGKGLIF